MIACARANRVVSARWERLSGGVAARVSVRRHLQRRRAPGPAGAPGAAGDRAAACRRASRGGEVRQHFHEAIGQASRGAVGRTAEQLGCLRGGDGQLLGQRRRRHALSWQQLHHVGHALGADLPGARRSRAGRRCRGQEVIHSGFEHWVRGRHRCSVGDHRRLSNASRGAPRTRAMPRRSMSRRKNRGPDRSRGTRASGASPRFGQPASGQLRHPLSPFAPRVREWFQLPSPRPLRHRSRPGRRSPRARTCCISAPTGSGKTLAAFLWGLDRLTAEPAPKGERRTRLLYVSPLKAL